MRMRIPMKIIAWVAFCAVMPLQAATGFWFCLPKGDVIDFHFPDRLQTYRRPNFASPQCSGANPSIEDCTVDTGLTEKEYIFQLFSLAGEPACLRGWFVAPGHTIQQEAFILPLDSTIVGTGGSFPTFANGTTDDMQNAFDTMFSAIYEDEFGTPTIRMKTHFYEYCDDPVNGCLDSNGYTFGCSQDGGEYLIKTFNRGEPPSNWWQTECSSASAKPGPPQ